MGLAVGVVATAGICGDAAPTDSHFGVVSFGPDKKEGTDDDIHSWDSKPKHQ